VSLKNTSSAVAMPAKRPWTRGSSGTAGPLSGFPLQGGLARQKTVAAPGWSL